MTDAILVLNAGSSSIKFELFTITGDDPESRLEGQMEGIGASPRLIARDARRQVLADHRWPGPDVADHATALRLMGQELAPAVEGYRIVAVGHRVVHGGPDLTAPVIVDDAVMEKLRALAPLAPLHQPHNLAGIAASRAALPDVPQVACFDTSFHRTHAWEADTFALPPEFYDRGIRRYGFHGLSYAYMATVLPERHGAIARGRTVVAHLGSGASLCAMQDLRSVATTMGFSALDGLMMGTRTGALDPGAVIYLMEIEKLSLAQVGRTLYHESGLLGVSGVSSDPRVLLEREVEDSAQGERARAALALYVRRIVREIGAMTAVLGGLDRLVFTAGIGEHNAVLRARVCEALAWLGIEIDAAANQAHAARIVTLASRVDVGVEPTNEEWVAARGALRVLG